MSFIFFCGGAFAEGKNVEKIIINERGKLIKVFSLKG